MDACTAITIFLTCAEQQDRRALTIPCPDPPREPGVRRSRTQEPEAVARRFSEPTAPGGFLQGHRPFHPIRKRKQTTKKGAPHKKRTRHPEAPGS